VVFELTVLHFADARPTVAEVYERAFAVVVLKIQVAAGIGPLELCGRVK
jgi:hypothetical protein